MREREVGERLMKDELVKLAEGSVLRREGGVHTPTLPKKGECADDDERGKIKCHRLRPRLRFKLN